jgi:death on curing protein
MQYLSRDEVLDLHAYVVTRYGGLLGVASQDRLLSAINAPQQRMFDAELYPDLASKAAILVYMIIKNRPFLGGNEGTALMVLLRFLAINGAALGDEVASDELFRLIRGMNHSDLDKQGLEDWLRETMRSVEQES